MGPKFDPTEVKFVYLRAVGGEVGATSSLAPKVTTVPTQGKNGKLFIYFMLYRLFLSHLYSPLRSAHLVCPPRRLVTTLPRPQRTGRDSRSLCSWGSKTGTYNKWTALGSGCSQIQCQASHLLCCSLCCCACHQGAEGAPKGTQEGN